MSSVLRAEHAAESPESSPDVPVGTVGAPHEAQLLHFGLQLLLPRPAAVQQSQPLLQASVLHDCQLALPLCGLSAAPLGSDLAVEGLDGSLESGVLLRRVLISLWFAEGATGGPESFHTPAVRGWIPETGQTMSRNV